MNNIRRPCEDNATMIKITMMQQRSTVDSRLPLTHFKILVQQCQHSGLWRQSV